MTGVLIIDGTTELSLTAYLPGVLNSFKSEFGGISILFTGKYCVSRYPVSELIGAASYRAFGASCMTKTAELSKSSVTYGVLPPVTPLEMGRGMGA